MAAQLLAFSALTDVDWSSFQTGDYPQLQSDGKFHGVTTSVDLSAYATIVYVDAQVATREAPLAFSAPLSRSVNTVSIPAATGSQNGYLASGDWTTFSSKENALTFAAPLSRSVNAISLNQGGITHANLAGLSADDHPQYALLAGRSGGQTLTGGTAASQNLLLKPTSHVTLGYVGVPYAPQGTANYGLFSLGSGGFAGTAPNFVGSASGTHFAMNAVGGYAGNLADWQVDGVGKFKVDANGWLYGDSTGAVLKLGNTGGVFDFTDGTTLRIRISSSTGGIQAGAANTYDLGQSATPFRTGYFGTDLQLWAASTVQQRLVAKLTHSLPTATDASRTGRLQFHVADFGAATGREAIRIDANGSALTGTLFGSWSASPASGSTGISSFGAGGGTGGQYGSDTGAAIQLLHTAAAAASINTIFVVEGRATGSPSNGYGVRFRWDLEDSAGNGVNAAAQEVSWVDATDATRKSRMTFWVYDNTAVREALRLDTDGTTPYVSLPGRGVVGATALNASAAFQVDSTTLGLLPPRMTTTQRDAIGTPLEGLVLYNTTTHAFTVRLASSWVEFGGSSINGTGSAGQVAYFSGTNTLASSGNFNWDNTNARLGVGVAPSTAIHLSGNTLVGASLTIENFATNGTQWRLISTTNALDATTANGSLVAQLGAAGARAIELTKEGSLKPVSLGSASANDTRFALHIRPYTTKLANWDPMVVYQTSAGASPMFLLDGLGGLTMDNVTAYAGSSGTQNILSLTGRNNQSSTAGFNMLLLNYIETAFGSGGVSLIEGQNNAVTNFRVRKDGRMTFTVPNAAPTDANIWNSGASAWLDETNGFLRFRIRDSGANLFTAWVPTGNANIAIADGATLATDAGIGGPTIRVSVTLAATPRTLGAPTNPTDRKAVTWLIKNSAGSTATLTLASGAGGFVLANGLTLPTITNGQTLFLSAVYDSTANRWWVLGLGTVN